MSSSPPHFDDDIYKASPAPRSRPKTVTIHGPSPSSSPANSSDKENSSSRTSAMDKETGRSSLDSKSRHQTAPTSGQGKRKRTVERDAMANASRRRRQTIEQEDEPIIDDSYDPDQDVEDRRILRSGMRNLTRALNENRVEYMAPDSSGLIDVLTKANDYSKQVKQTSDATIDSRLLVTTSDLAYKRTLNMISGNTSQKVDVEDLVSACARFMRRAGTADNLLSQAPSTQRRRRVMDDDEDENDGDTLNWEHLGRFACCHNSRPAVPGFLLGPLSLQKRAKRVVIRKAVLKPSQLTQSRPEILKAGDIVKDENENLTTLCTQILSRLNKVSKDIQTAVEAEAEDMSEEEADDLLTRHHISENGGIAYFPFVINQKHFGQTIENMFYVSFLIRDGWLSIEEGKDGMPYIVQRDNNEVEAGGKVKTESARHQAVIALDEDQWTELIDLFNLKGKEPMILHRQETERPADGKGWYA